MIFPELTDILFGIFQTGLELGIFVQIQSTMIAGSSCGHQSTQTSRNGNHDDLKVVDVESVGARDGCKGYDGSSNG